MRKDKLYELAKFPPKVIREAHDLFLTYLPEETREPSYAELRIDFGAEEWHYDSDAEFFEDYRQEDCDAIYSKQYWSYWLMLRLTTHGTRVVVSLPNREAIQNIHSVFEDTYQASKQPPPPVRRPRVFIGHGRNTLWRELKDHLHEQHGYEVEAYEIGARAGHTIRDILDEMLKKSSFALLVMTGEDETAEGTLHPRLNVVHESGLFQGRLGFHRAIVLLEEGAEEFGNIAGIQQLRFSKGNIKEIFGDVVATLRREFP
jgi:hypothetical protein